MADEPKNEGRKDNNRCLHKAKLKNFLQNDSDRIFGLIVKGYHGDIATPTKKAWDEEITILKKVLEPWKNADDGEAYIFLEYEIPRLGKRIDAVLLLKGIIFCLEFKVGEKDVLKGDLEQVLDYALDLKNFHKFSLERPIVPILIPTECAALQLNLKCGEYSDLVFTPAIVNGARLGEVIATYVEKFAAEYKKDEWGERWLNSPYSPTPTIIEAARRLYEGHTVEDITRHEADKVSTDQTIAYLRDVIKECKAEKKKAICFVTGVPGAGKTLVGLEIAAKQKQEKNEDCRENQAVYLSGNGPLVAVLKEALARDVKSKSAMKGKTITLKDARQGVDKTIQGVHHYRTNMLRRIVNPVQDGVLEIDTTQAIENGDAGYGEVEHVVIFDEAQRAWTHKRLADYLKRGGTYGNQFRVENFPVSEANFLIWSVNLRKDWAVIICLVGGGQEINTGEAGISEWIEAINTSFPKWEIYISPQLIASEYAEGKVQDLLKANSKVKVVYSKSLHLAVSLRSFRAERLSDFVHALLAIDEKSAALYQEVVKKAEGRPGYPIYLTRDINKARAWLRQMARGTSRTGVLVSKVAARFKPQAVNVLAQGDDYSVHWFLEDKDDVRSSNYLEDAATEIQVQGLELDYTCVLWDADFRYENGIWGYYKFNGKTAWTNEKNEEARKYMLNAYRVLLTRARQGMVICVPEGNSKKNAEGLPEDPTRLAEFYDGTYSYLKNLDIQEL